ncbi:MAG: HEAT repeat domain-containing protein [Treponema sp.]|nr:HEAT repeat domain-containing protein [Treponema sp.]
MKFAKVLFCVICFAAFSSLSFAQEQRVQKQTNATRRSETSVENEYLNDIDSVVVLTLAKSEEYDNKLVALQYLEDAVGSGNISQEIVAALDQLAGEGINNPSRLNGRIMNNYPDIRRRACLLLGQVGGVHSKNTLVNIAIADNEPMVQSAAIRALGEMGYNENDEATDAIAFANHRNRILNPTSSMAIETLDAFEKLAANTEDKRAMIDEISKIAADYHYSSAVRKRALEVLKGIRLDSSSSSKSTADAK